MTPPPRRKIERRLERFIVDELLDESYGGGDPLATGAVDSLGLEQLADYMEEVFGLRVDDEEMTRRNFASVPALAAFVESKLAASR